MCFRPAAVELKKNCPKCGTENDQSAEVCSQCGEALPASPFAGAVPGAPGTPAGAPAAPGTPAGAPAAPGTPSAPKAPGAPAPGAPGTPSK